jgi:hypothetical protein
MRALWAPYPVKGGSFTSHGPLGMSQNAIMPIKRRLSQNCAYVPAEIC